MTRRETIAKRQNMGLSAEQAAAKIGIARNTLARFERGDTLIFANLKLIADFYGCKVTDLEPATPPAEPAPAEEQAA